MIQFTAVRLLLWALLLSSLVGLTAWWWHWQIAAWLGVLAALLILAWHISHLHALVKHLVVSQQAAPAGARTTVPTALGDWGEVFYQLHRYERQHTQQLTALQDQQNRFMQAVQASPNAFVLLDDAGRVAWLNTAAQTLLGLDAQRDTGQNLAFLLRTPAVAALLDSTRERQAVTVQLADPMVKALSRTVTVQSFPFGDQQTLLLGQDVTELERTEQVRRDFVANVSHELRTPLTVLTGYAELLQDHAAQLPSALRDAVQHIAQHSQRMNQLTQDLLQLASLEANHKAQPSLQSYDPVSVPLWVQSVLDSAQPIARTAGVQLHWENSSADAHVRGDLAALHSALSNLLVNAIRYSKFGDTVTVATRTDLASAQCHLSVSDTGCGIAAEHIPRLTERFYRVSASRSRDQGGTGLGLAIVKHIMLQHGGELRIASELGKGSVFTLILPLVLQSAS